MQPRLGLKDVCENDTYCWAVTTLKGPRVTVQHPRPQSPLGEGRGSQGRSLQAGKKGCTLAGQGFGLSWGP